MNCPWDNFQSDPNTYCEANICGWIVQPANTWSNVGYLIAAIIILRNKNLDQNRYWFAAITFVLFVGSTLFHMTSTYPARVLDVGAMLMLSGFMLSLTMVRYFKWPPKWLFILAPAIILSSLPNVGFSKWGSLTFIIQCLAAATVEIVSFKKNNVSREQVAWIKNALLIFLVALGLNITDMKRLLCQPGWFFFNPNNNILTLHAIWHLMCAYSIYLAVKYYSYKKPNGPASLN